VTSPATLTNRILGAAVGALLVGAVSVAVVVGPDEDTAVLTTSTTQSPPATSDNDTDDTVPAEYDDPEYRDATDFEQEFIEGIDAVVGKAFVRDRDVRAATVEYPFPTTWPERVPPVRTNPLRYGIFTSFSYGGGMWQPPFQASSFGLDDDGLVCRPEKMFNVMACGVASTLRGRFQVVVERSPQSANDWHFLESMDLTVYSEMDDGESKFAMSVLQSRIAVPKCPEESQAGRVSLRKFRIGTDDVFVLVLSGGAIIGESTTSGGYATNDAVTVIAMNSSGLPEVVAGYEFEDLKQIAATDRSLVLTAGNGFDVQDESYSARIIELVTNEDGWRERMHPLSRSHRAWKIAHVADFPGSTTRGTSLGLTLLDYLTLQYAYGDTNNCRAEE